MEASRGSTTAGEEEEYILDGAGRRWLQHWPLSKYHRVQVLLVQWEDEDLNVDEEVKRLEAVFSCDYPEGYNFLTQRYSIPNDNPEDKLAVQLLDFRKGVTDQDLMIVYYAGHAGGSTQKCIWAAKRESDSPRLNWHNIQGLILGYPADALLILDCCFATLAARNNGIGDNWMLGASNKETEATGVARNSFTSTLTRELERCAAMYWSKRETLSVQSLDHALVVWDRDLNFTPKLTRLTDHECPATDLTPLLHPCQRHRMQTTRTEPPPEVRQQDSIPPLPSRPMNSSSSVLKGSGLLAGLERLRRATVGLQSLRILNLPASTDNLDIVRWFEERFIKRSSIHNIGPKIVSGSTFLGVIITFAGIGIAEQATRIADLRFLPRSGKSYRQSTQQLVIDDKFEGLTCIYSSTRGPDKEPTADIILVHGAHGHPISSFTVQTAEPSSETSWARDSLSKELEDAEIFPRVFTYGWNASAWDDPEREIESAHTVLARALKDIGCQGHTRPQILVGHGVGGFLIKQLVINTINFGFGERNFRNPIQACFFLALPEVSDYSDLTKIQTESQTACWRDPRLSSHSQDLNSRFQEISNISEEFDIIRKEWGIKCIFFKEAHKDVKYLNGAHHEAGLAEPSVKLDTDYVGAAKLPDKESSLSIVLNEMRKALTKERKQPLKPRPKNAERVFAKLKGYDTRFLVDDSDSMNGRRWTTTKSVMAQIASIAVNYDKDGVDVRFFNAFPDDEERLNLDSAEKVMSLFENLEPDGETPTADTLETELNEYVHEYKINRRIKGLNLIVVTDGAPSPGQDVEGVIVKYAKQLAQQDAPPLQVGIQFVQIGDEKGAKDFLDSLDNNLQTKYDLDRDVSPNFMLSSRLGSANDKSTDGGYGTLG